MSSRAQHHQDQHAARVMTNRRQEWTPGTASTDNRTSDAERMRRLLNRMDGRNKSCQGRCQPSNRKDDASRATGRTMPAERQGGRYHPSNEEDYRLRIRPAMTRSSPTSEGWDQPSDNGDDGPAEQRG
ncbi:hypothetical protein BDZ89DRAFT_1041110 [Hymenopellis radicata]|nr:hypothetical protein BDZ89DRAFT_1041110 [Hymenopellis radicata]